MRHQSRSMSGLAVASAREGGPGCLGLAAVAVAAVILDVGLVALGLLTYRWLVGP